MHYCQCVCVCVCSQTDRFNPWLLANFLSNPDTLSYKFSMKSFLSTFIPSFFLQEHVEGRRCDSCRHNFHTLEQRNSLGCLPCVCDISGTVSGGLCDMQTGQCPCKEGVEGVQCTNCAHNYYNQTLDVESKRTPNCNLNP